MAIKLNSFTLPDNTIKEMEHTLGKALTTGNEHGFNLCISSDKIIKPGNVCKGEKCSMDISGFMCNKNEINIGVFHTHGKSSTPSMSDLSVGYLVGMNCIGSPKEIICFSRKKDIDALAYADIKNVEGKEEQTKFHHSRWKNKEISTREYTKIYSEYKKEVDRIIHDHFEETKIK